MRSERKRARPGLSAAIVGGTAVLAACAGDAGPEAYVERLGMDTIAVETVERDDGRITGEIVARSPVARRITYALEFDEAGNVTRFETEHTTPPENPSGPVRWHAAVTFEDGRATVERSIAADTETVTVDVSGVIVPTTGRTPMAAGMVEYAVGRARSAGADEPYAIQVFTPWGSSPRTSPNEVTPRGGGEYALDFFGSPLVVSVDADGHVVGISGAETTMKIEVEPAGDVSLDALAADYASRDASGEGIGQPSPEASVTASGGGADFEIVYSRPAMRGREIWGGLVPWEEVWRTGANAATHFTTSRDVTIGDLEVPTGTYTLWTTFTPESAFLIVNERTQIWGTAYDASTDLGRTALETSELQEPVERFTIEIEPTATGGLLHLSWDRTRYSVPIRVR